MAKLNQGIFKPNNPKKYRGDASNIIYRSGYELSFMMWADQNANVLEWSSEEIVIPYRTVLDEMREANGGRRTVHRYFVDFYIRIKEASGTENKYLVEIKPLHETKEPVMSSKKKKSTYLFEMKRWIINSSKWEAARKFAEMHGMKFKIITEVELYGRKS